MFATCICKHIIIDFSLFYLLYDINLRLPDDATKFTFNSYEERINSKSFFNRNKTKTFKKNMQRANENKIAWNAKVKDKIFAIDEMILIHIKKFKKFEINWYKLYKVIQKKILNINISKFLKSSFNKYLINNNRMKLININKVISKD